MKIHILVVLVLSSAACYPALSPAEEQAQEKEAREAAKVEYSNKKAERDLAFLEAQKSPPEGEQARLERYAAAQEKSRADQLERERLACVPGRQERVEARARYEKAVEHVNELQEWENTHCKEHVYYGKPTIVADYYKNGEIRYRQGDNATQVRKCDAPLPKELEHQHADQIFVPQPTFAMGCEKWDEEAAK